MVHVELGSAMITGQGVATYVSPVGLATRINILISKIVFDYLITLFCSSCSLDLQGYKGQNRSPASFVRNLLIIDLSHC